jgi:hypothetical protein
VASPNQAAPDSSVTEPSSRLVTAYRIGGWRKYLKIVPAAPDRFWMDFTTDGWANRCLPLRIANQSGWCLLNDADFEVTWTGSQQLDGVKLKFAKGQSSASVNSMFGYGVVTWVIPYLFRTPPGFNLLVRGPANSPKDGVVALDGIVETDWLPYPFTMNWKVTRPSRTVKFERNEPICMIMPIRREDIETFHPEIRNLESDAELNRGYQAWHERRAALVKSIKEKPPDRKDKPTQGNYIRGEGVLGEKTSGHQAKLEIRTFAEAEPAPEPPAIVPQLPPPEEGLFARLFRKRQ